MGTDQYSDAPAPHPAGEPEAWMPVASASDSHMTEEDQPATPWQSNSPTGTGGALPPGTPNWPTEGFGAPPGPPPYYYGYGGSYGGGYYGGDFGGGQPPRRRRRGLAIVLVAVALLVTLGAGIGIGHFAFAAGGSPSQTAALVGGATAPAVTVSTNVSSLQQAVENVTKAVEPSVVEITSVGNGQEAIGSGDILTTSGYIVTNDHVVDGFNNFTVTLSNGTKLQAQLVGTDPQDDLAVIKVSANNLKPIAIADSSQVQVNEFVVAIGNPYGERNSASFGTVSAVNRTESESPDGPASVLTGLIQTTAPIAPGNSGGALVNLQGQLVGIPTLGTSSGQRGPGGSGVPGGSGSTGATVGFAIPSNQVKTVSQQLIQSGHVATTGQGFMGIQGQDVTPYVAAQDGLNVQSGVLIAGFANDSAGQSPARQAGLQTGDVITAINGQDINDSTDLAGAVITHAPGTQIKVTVMRGSNHLTVTVTLGQRPANIQG